MKGKYIFLRIVTMVLTFFIGALPVSRINTSPAGAREETVVEQKSKQQASQGCKIAEDLSKAFEAAAERVLPSVVPIFSEQEVLQYATPFGAPDDPLRRFFGDDFFKRFFGTPGEGRKRTVRGIGSGVIATEDGYILTNNHVVRSADKLTVVLSDQKKYSARVIAADPQTDVAVIKIDEKGLPAAQLGNSDDVKIGQWVIAVGNPFQLLHSVTAGIISAKGRSSVGLADYEDFIQTDASINPGNSGGALSDLNGNVVGINTAITSPSGGSVGIGFAIPINMARRVMDELLSEGKVSRGYMGILPQRIDENLARAMKLKSTDGVLVGDVSQGGPADRAGIERGDVIVELDDQKLKNDLELRKLVALTPPGTSIKIKLMRDGKEKEVKVVLGERPAEPGVAAPQKEEPRERRYQELGISVQALTPDIAEQLGYSDERGVIVAGVYAGSVAEEAGLRRGDLIKEINRIEVSTLEEFRKEIDRLDSGESAALLIRRGAGTFFIALQVP